MTLREQWEPWGGRQQLPQLTQPVRTRGCHLQLSASGKHQNLEQSPLLSTGVRGWPPEPRDPHRPRPSRSLTWLQRDPRSWRQGHTQASLIPMTLAGLAHPDHRAASLPPATMVLVRCGERHLLPAPACSLQVSDLCPHSLLPWVLQGHRGFSS